MNVSIPSEVRGLVRQAAISTAALEREGLDDSAWICRAVCEKLQREWPILALGDAVPDVVRSLAGRGVEAAPLHVRFSTVAGSRG